MATQHMTLLEDLKRAAWSRTSRKPVTEGSTGNPVVTRTSDLRPGVRPRLRITSRTTLNVLASRPRSIA